MAFPNNANDSVPKLLLTLVNMVLEEPGMKDQKTSTYNCTAAKIQQCETPVPSYVGLVLHAHTRKREL